MSRILGVACDSCGTLDIEINPSINFTEDDFPRRGWVSLTEWNGEEKGVAEADEIHLCSVECLASFSNVALSSENETSHDHEHGHEHEQN
jgi:hypothetical protein